MSFGDTFELVVVVISLIISCTAAAIAWHFTETGFYCRRQIGARLGCNCRYYKIIEKDEDIYVYTYSSTNEGLLKVRVQKFKPFLEITKLDEDGNPIVSNERKQLRSCFDQDLILKTN